MGASGSTCRSEYTVLGNPAVTGYLSRCFQEIARGITAIVGGNLSAILLVGGFGRGEGSVAVHGSQIRIVNDIDIIVVVKGITRAWAKIIEALYGSRLDKLLADICSRYGIKQIDLNVRTISHFRSADMRTIEYQEIKYGHVLLWGSGDPCVEMPDVAWSQPTLDEGARLFKNRGGGLLLAAMYFFSDDVAFESSRENLFVECNKATISAGDEHLLLNGSYDWSYCRRAAVAADLLLNGPDDIRDLMELYLRALRWKLRPTDSEWKKLDRDSGLALWMQARTTLLKYSLKFESARHDRKFSSWMEYAAFVLQSSRPRLTATIREFVRGRRGQWLRIAATPNLQVSLVALLLCAWSDDRSISEPHVSAASDILRYTSKNNLEPKQRWLFATEKYLTFWHPKGEVAKALAHRMKSDARRAPNVRARWDHRTSRNQRRS